MKKILLMLKRHSGRAGIILIILSLCSLITYAQGDLLTIRGTVKDDTGMTIPGVTVKAGNTALPTDINGGFTIKAAKGSAITFTSTGYDPQTIIVKGPEPLVITMVTTKTSLNEVVVVAYGTQKKASVTGAVSSIQSADLIRTPAATTSGALTGIQGVNLRSTTGQPGSSTNIQIRNMGTPLYVIDGIPQSEGQFNQLGIEDIESISVLKDAAAAIYGFRASNGVVLVTTKKGKQGKNNINVSSYYGLQNVTRYMEPSNAYQYQLAIDQGDQNTGVTPRVNATELAKWQAGTDPGYQSTNYKDVIIQKNAPQKYLNVSTSGGTDRMNYYLSLSGLRQDAILKEYNFDRKNFQTNVEGTIFNGLKIGTMLSGRIESRHNVASTTDQAVTYDNPFLAILTMWPTEHMFANDNPDYLNANLNNRGRNPGIYNEAVIGSEDNVWHNFGSIFYASASLPFGIQAKATYSFNYKQNAVEFFRKNYNMYNYVASTDSYTPVPITAAARSKGRTEIQENFAQLQLNYSKTLGKHSIAAFAGYEYSNSMTQGTTVTSTPPTNILETVGFPEVTGFTSFYTPAIRASLIGKVNYDYKQKYLVEMLGRYDGTSLYGNGKRFGFFPGVTAGWRISEENFIKEKLPVISNLKLRLSWGKTGLEQGVNPFDYLGGGTYYNGSYVLNAGAVTSGIGLRPPPITNITWVNSTMINAGLDLGLFNNVLSTTVDVFERKLTGVPAQKLDVLVPSEIGYALPLENLNANHIQGVEAIVTYAKQANKVRYSISANATLARQKNDFIYGERYGNSLDEYRNRNANRWSNVYWGYEITGQFQSVDQIKNYKINNDNQGNTTELPGDLMFKDQNGDGVINSQDERPLGYALGATPYLTFGLNTSVSYKGIDLLTDWAGGSMQSFYRNLEIQVPFQGNHNSPNFLFDDVWHHADVFDPTSPWIPGKYPPIRTGGGTLRTYTANSSFWMKNVKYLRLKNLQIGYNFPSKMLTKTHISKLRLYFTGTNLFSFDNVKDIQIDPEISLRSALVYPNTRVYTLGLNLTL